MGAIIPKLRQSARGQRCTLNTPFCNHDPETTVLAHLPSNVKGLATKSDDWNACFACSGCHEALDNHMLKEQHYYCLQALQRTQKIWFDMGLITIPGQIKQPPKPSAKIMPRRPFVVQGDA